MQPGFADRRTARIPAAATAIPDRPPANPQTNAYFGDVHVHTGWSFDAFTNGSRTTPADAWEAASQGNPFKYGFENDPGHRLNSVHGQPEDQVQQVREFSSGRLAGVWAGENTREGETNFVFEGKTYYYSDKNVARMELQSFRG